MYIYIYTYIYIYMCVYIYLFILVFIAPEILQLDNVSPLKDTIGKGLPV